MAQPSLDDDRAVRLADNFYDWAIHCALQPGRSRSMCAQIPLFSAILGLETNSPAPCLKGSPLSTRKSRESLRGSSQTSDVIRLVADANPIRRCRAAWFGTQAIFLQNRLGVFDQRFVLFVTFPDAEFEEFDFLGIGAVARCRACPASRSCFGNGSRRPSGHLIGNFLRKVRVAYRGCEAPLRCGVRQNGVLNLDEVAANFGNWPRRARGACGQ